LARTPDILKTLTQKGRKPNQVVVGFAAEAEDLINQAFLKLQNKNLDYIVANQAGGPNSAFASSEIKVTLLNPEKKEFELGPGPKFGVAWALMNKLAEDSRLKSLEDFI
jgi:phosphopantothenoylcysteine decarboxylase/phosphopantothenate--cysteine ligase